MDIRLPEDMERSLEDAVHGGRFTSVDDAMAEAWRSFLRQPEREQTRGAMTANDLHRQMIADGLLKQLPDEAQDIDDDQDDEPEMIEGEPLSETIIRER